MASVKISDLSSADDLAFAELTQEEQAKVTGGGIGALGGLPTAILGGTAGALVGSEFGSSDGTNGTGALIGSAIGAALPK